jgi:hypothetical protein
LYNLQEIDIDVVEFARFFGYKTNFIPQGFNFIREEIVAKCLDEFGGIDQAISFLTNGTLKTTTGAFYNSVKQHGERKRVVREVDFMKTIGSTFKSGEPSLHDLLRQIHEGKIQLPDFSAGLGMGR